MARPTLRILIEALAKQGKTWLASTAPPPVLFLDFEHRAKYVPGGDQATLWNGTDDPMQLQPSPSRLYIHEVDDMNRYFQAVSWLRSRKHPYKTVVMDSAMEMRSKILYGKFPNIEAMDGKDFGTINRLVEMAIKDILNLTKDEANECDVAVIINGTVIDDYSKKIKPLGLGSVSHQITHWVDVIAYLDNNNGRRLWLGDRADQDLLVGDGTNKLITTFGTSILNPNVSVLYQALEKQNGQTT